MITRVAFSRVLLGINDPPRRTKRSLGRTSARDLVHPLKHRSTVHHHPNSPRDHRSDHVLFLSLHVVENMNRAIVRTAANALIPSVHFLSPYLCGVIQPKNFKRKPTRSTDEVKICLAVEECFRGIRYVP